MIIKNKSKIWKRIIIYISNSFINSQNDIDKWRKSISEYEMTGSFRYTTEQHAHGDAITDIDP